MVGLASVSSLATGEVEGGGEEGEEGEGGGEAKPDHADTFEEDDDGDIDPEDIEGLDDDTVKPKARKKRAGKKK